jgi:hypothetical protein
MISDIIQDFRDFGSWFTQWCFLKRQAVKMGLAIGLADMKQKAFNRQYHIMLLRLPKGEKLVSLNREDIQQFIRKKWLPKKTTMFQLRHSNSIFYSTPLYRNNQSNAAERKKAKERYVRYSKRWLRN